MALDLQSHPGGTILPVRAQPGARRNEVQGVHDAALKVCVTQAPEKGKANKAIADVLAKWLGVKKSQVELMAGETASQKKFFIRGVETQDLAKLVQEKLNEHEQPQT